MINLKVFSNFSLGESILKPINIIELAIENQQKMVGMISRMNMFGVMEFSSLAIKNKIKPIIACLLNVEEYGWISVYIKNKLGYINLSKLITDFYLKEKKIISLKDFLNLNHVIVLWGGEESSFLNFIDLEKKAEILKNNFKNNFYLELQNISYKDMILKAAFNLNIPLVYTKNIFFSKGNFEAFYVFDCIFKNKVYMEDDLNNHMHKNSYFLSTEEIKNFSIYEEAYLNALSIGERCNFVLESIPPMIPKFVEQNSYEILKDIVLKNLKERIKNIEEDKKEIYFLRIEKELNILKEKDFCNYFLVTYDFIKKAGELGVPVGPGRGSGTGSLVAYSLYITNVDPIKFKLVFERFLNPERISLPDLDIDYCHEKREKVIDYLVEKYGRENISKIITFGTLKSRIVVRDVGRALMIPLKIIDNICKFIPQDQVNPLSLKEIVEIDNKLMEMFTANSNTDKLLKICIQLEGLVRHISTHAAGIVIFKNSENETISNYMPLYKIDGEITTQFSMKYVEMIGMVKFDFLGLQTLTLIQNTCELIKKNKNIEINISQISLEDKTTFDFISSLNLAGVFQLDSFGMKSIIYDLQPNSLDEIIAIIALFRPGPMDFIPNYISNKKNPSQIVYELPILKEILENTYGIIVYQEQVLEIAVKIANYSLGEADVLRRAMGKKDPLEMKNQEKKFLEGAKKNKINEKIAISLFEKMSDFAGYGFNKSHAAPYGLLSYQTAYLKTHFPLEFMTCLINLDKQDINKVLTYVNDLKNLKIKLLPPCIQFSEENFIIENEHIRYGLSCIKNMGETFAKQIVEERKKNGLYFSVDDFIHRNLSFINKRQLEFLIYSGGFDYFEIKKNILISNLEILTKGESVLENTNILEEDPYWEMEALGFFLKNHPLAKENFSSLKIYTLTDIFKLEENKAFIKMTGILYSILKKKTHYNNKSYMFLKVLDTTGMYEITLFSDTIDKYLNLIKIKTALVFDVVYEKKQNIIKIIAHKIYSFSDYKLSSINSLKITCRKKMFNSLSEILLKYSQQNYLKKKNSYIILLYQKKEYLLPYNIVITSELIQDLLKIFVIIHNYDYI